MINYLADKAKSFSQKKSTAHLYVNNLSRIPIVSHDDTNQYLTVQAILKYFFQAKILSLGKKGKA